MKQKAKEVKNLDSKKKNGETENPDSRWQTLSAGISAVIERLMKEKEDLNTKTRLAKKLGYAQSAISDIFNKNKPSRCWSMPLLLRVAEEFNVEAWAIIKAAGEKDEGYAWLTLRLADTEPATETRLDRIVKAIAPEGTETQLKNLYYTSQMFSVSAPDYVARYLKGDVNDMDVYLKLKRALKESMESPEREPLWHVVKRTFETKTKEEL